MTGLSGSSSGFLLLRGWYCWLCYIGVPSETSVSESGFAFGIGVQILTNETNHGSCWTSWKGLIRGHFLYLFWIRNKSRLLIGKSYPLKLLKIAQNQAKCFYCLSSREYPASYNFYCCVKLLNILFRLVKENRFRIFSQNSVLTVAWDKMLESFFFLLAIICVFFKCFVFVQNAVCENRYGDSN